MRLPSSGELVGGTSYIEPVPQHRRVEIGWTWYRPDQWAGPVNPECKLLLLSQAFDALGFNRVQLVTDLLNTRSQAAIAKLGATHEGVLRSVGSWVARRIPGRQVPPFIAAQLAGAFAASGLLFAMHPTTRRSARRSRTAPRGTPSCWKCG